MSGEHVRLDVLRVRSVRDSEAKPSGKKLNTWFSRCLVFLQIGSRKGLCGRPKQTGVPILPTSNSTLLGEHGSRCLRL